MSSSQLAHVRTTPAHEQAVSALSARVAQHVLIGRLITDAHDRRPVRTWRPDLWPWPVWAFLLTVPVGALTAALLAVLVFTHLLPSPL